MTDTESQKEQRAFMLYEGNVARWLVIVEASSLWCDFALYQAVAWKSDHGDCPQFDSKTTFVQVKPWSNKSKPAMTGFVQWDGCTGFSAGGIHFLGGARAYEELHDVTQVAMEKAHDLMTQLSKKPLGWSLPYQRHWDRFEQVPYDLPERWVPERAS